MTATAGILRHHDLDHPPQSTRPTSSSNAIPDYDPTSQNFEEVTQNDETNEIQNLYHEQHSMLNLLLKEVQDIKNVDSSLSERPLSKFLASEDGMKAAGFIATTSTADLKAEFLNLCHLVKSKEEERERVLAEVEMLRVELGMTYRTQPTPSMQFDVSAKPQTDMQKRLEELTTSVHMTPTRAAARGAVHKQRRFKADSLLAQLHDEHHEWCVLHYSELTDEEFMPVSTGAVRRVRRITLIQAWPTWGVRVT